MDEQNQSDHTVSSPHSAVLAGETVDSDEKGHLSSDLVYLSSVIEAAVFSSPEPLSLKSLLSLFGGEVTEELIQSLLSALKTHYHDRGVELTESAGGWRFQTSQRVQFHLDRLRQMKPPKYSRAVMETLAIVAYRQPVTRGEIEEIRGVSVSPQIIKTLEDREWIVVKGRRESVGRPALYVTTVRFLDDFGLKRLSDLPSLKTFGPALESVSDLLPKENGDTCLDDS